MMHKTLLLTGLLLAGTALAGRLPEEIIEQVDGARVVTFLTASDISASPAWEPLSGPPPLGVDGVTRVLQDYADSHPNLAGTRLEKLSLKPIPRHERNWHYLAVMDHNAQGKPHYLVVLMNGQVYPAMEEPASVR